MNSVYLRNISLFCISLFSFISADNVGMIIVATGKYTMFVEDLVKSARENFLPDHKRTFFVFTDGEIPQDYDIVKCHHKRVGWPFDTLVRHYASYNYRDILSSMDHLYYCDADTVFDGVIGDELLGDLVGAQAIYHIDNMKPYADVQSSSVAFVPLEKRGKYCSGSFYGGKAEEYLKMMDAVVEGIEKDWMNGFFATHHDESYLNHYLSHYKNTKISPYCVIDCDKHPEEPRVILQVSKDFSAVRKADKWRADNECDQWWLDCFDSCSESMLTKFGKTNSMSRKYVRDYIINKKYKTVLDAGCGYFMDYFGFKEEDGSISYRGLDIVPYFIALADTMKVSADHGTVENMPYENNSFDVVYTRHVVEHLESFEKVVSEMIRCAKKEVIIALSSRRPKYGKKRMKPHYYNHQEALLDRLSNIEDVDYFKSEKLDNGETVIFVTLK